MDINYDEDLSENPFFQELQSEQADVFRHAIEEGWIICVPRIGAIKRLVLTSEDLFSHILIPSDELPESHFRSLTGKFVRLYNRVVTVDQDNDTSYSSTHIVFEETYYTQDFLKYKVWCLEAPLGRYNSGAEQNISFISTLRDCIDFLWTESLGKEILENLDGAIETFLKETPPLEVTNLQSEIESIGRLYKNCLLVTLAEVRGKEKMMRNQLMMDNLKLAVETYMQHGVYKRLFESICACTAYEDAKLNKLIKNLSDLQLRDLDIRQDFYETIPCAKQELAKISGYSTVIGKVGCLRKTIAAITKQNHTIKTFISTDEFLPLMVFLVIKTGLANWHAHVAFMNKFQYSSVPSGEASFLITTLEAAIEHIRSEALLGPQEPESQLDEDFLNSYEMISLQSLDSKNYSSEKRFSTAYLFEQIRIANCEEVRLILDRSVDLKKNSVLSEEQTAKLCHPLCSCDTCEQFLSKSLCDTTPTVNSCDDRGFTALHLACFHGRPKVVELLLTYHADVNATDYSIATPLHYAASRGHQNVLLLMLHSGADLNAVDAEKNTPLHFAAINGHEGCVKAMLYFSEHGSSKLAINAENSLGDTPLHHAARWGYEGIVDILLEYGAGIKIENKRKLTALDCAHSIHISRLLYERRSKTNIFVVVPLHSTVRQQSVQLDFAEDVVNSPAVVRRFGIRPQSTMEITRIESLLHAVEFGDFNLTCFYLDIPVTNNPHTTDVCAMSPSLCHPLCTCAKCFPQDIESEGDDNVIRQRPRHFVDVNACNSDGVTALHMAAIHGRTDITRLLLDHGAEATLQTRNRGYTPLHFACKHRWSAVVRLLVQAPDCEVDAQDVAGNTSLFYACQTGDLRLVEILVAAMANPLLKNCDGKSSLDEADDRMLISIVNLLKANIPD